MVRLYCRAGVEEDIVELAAWLSDVSLSLASRFVDSAELSLRFLAERPGVGSLKSFEDSALADVRTWFVKAFPIISSITASVRMELMSWQFCMAREMSNQFCWDAIDPDHYWR